MYSMNQSDLENLDFKSNDQIQVGVSLQHLLLSCYLGLGKLSFHVSKAHLRGQKPKVGEAEPMSWFQNRKSNFDVPLTNECKSKPKYLKRNIAMAFVQKHHDTHFPPFCFFSGRSLAQLWEEKTQCQGYPFRVLGGAEGTSYNGRGSRFPFLQCTPATLGVAQLL